MTRDFYKSLDREFEIFGLKGKWVTIAGAGLGAAVVLGLVIGSVFGTAAGIVTTVVVVSVVFFGSVTLQVKVPSRRLSKLLIQSKCKRQHVTRRETLSRILLEYSWKEE